jgi:hypothetical protein
MTQALYTYINNKRKKKKKDHQFQGPCNLVRDKTKNHKTARGRWLTPVILVSQEAEITRITGQIVL